jgi:hypothetical protein
VIDLERDVLNPQQGAHMEFNNRVTFGRLLDMWPYTVVGMGASLNRADCQYELTGVICPTGDIDIEECYHVAIIKGGDGVWRKYADNNVVSFGPDDEKKGLDSQFSGDLSRTSKELQRTSNVDMLIYRKTCTSTSSLPPSCTNTTTGWEVKHDEVVGPTEQQPYILFNPAIITPLNAVFDEIFLNAPVGTASYSDTFNALIVYFIHMVLDNGDEKQIAGWVNTIGRNMNLMYPTLPDGSNHRFKLLKWLRAAVTHT